MGKSTELQFSQRHLEGILDRGTGRPCTPEEWERSKPGAVKIHEHEKPKGGSMQVIARLQGRRD